MNKFTTSSGCDPHNGRIEENDDEFTLAPTGTLARFVSVFRSFERGGAVQQQFGGSQAKDSCNNRRITVGVISYCMVHCELAGRNILSETLTGTRLEYGIEMCELVQSDSTSP